MATQVALAIKIQSEGGEKVLKNLQDLETELGRLQGELKGLDFGSDAFNAAVKDINRIKSAIKDVDKATEGLETAQRVQAIGEAISIVVGTFQLLTGVIGIFVSESEDLEKVQRAEAVATSVLNTAVGLQTIIFQQAELAAKGYSLQQLASQAITKTWTFATNLATAAQLAFNAALRANPIGLIITSIAALSAAIYGLIQAYKSANEPINEQNEISKETINIENDLISTRKKSATELKNQLRILTDNIETRNLEKKTIEDLKKTYPGLNAFLDENNRLTKEGIELIELNIDAREAEAALLQVRQKQVDEEIRFAQAEAEIRKEYKFTQQANNLLDKQRERSKITLAALQVVEEKYSKQLDEVQGKLDPLNKKLEAKRKAEEAAAKATENAITPEERRLKLLQNRIDLLNEVNKVLNLQSTQELKLVDDVLKKENDIIEEQNNLLGLRRQELNATQILLEDLNKLFFQSIPRAEEVVGLGSKLLPFFEEIREAFKSGDLDFTKGFSFNDFVEFAETKLPGISQILAELPKESRKQFTEYFNTIFNRVTTLQAAFQNLEGFDFVQDNEQALQTILDIEEDILSIRLQGEEIGIEEESIRNLQIKQIKERLGLFAQERNIVKQIDELTLQYQKALESGDEKLSNTLKSQIIALGEQLKVQNTIAETILTQAENGVKFSQELKKVGEQSQKNLGIINQNKKALDATFDPEQLRKYFSGLGDDLETIFPTLILDLESYLERFGQAGTEAIIQGVIDGLREQGKLTRQEAEKIIDVLEKAGLALKAVFGFAFDPFAEQLKMLRKLIKGLADESRQIPKAFVNLQEVTEDYFQVLGDLSGRLEQVIAQNNANLLDQLEFEQQAALAQIGEANAATQRENDRINAERLATEKRFAQLRFDIEKKARVQELQFALASAIADGAQAIINALATIPPPLGAVYAAGLGVLTGAQIQVINNQLTTAKSKTFIARRGGLISGGASHEQGGVPALLEGGEFIVNREAVAQFGNIISDLNSSTGGRKLAIDDSRLVQAIASQNQTSPPLKAYVLYNSIQDTEKLNRKITNLSRL